MTSIEKYDYVRPSDTMDYRNNNNTNNISSVINDSGIYDRLFKDRTKLKLKKSKSICERNKATIPIDFKSIIKTSYFI
jgi:hypothetical protein